MLTDIGKEFAERRHIDANRRAEIDAIERDNLFGYDYDIVDGLVRDEKLAIAVVDETARGVLDNLTARIHIGGLTILVGQDLNVEKPADYDKPEEGHDTPDNQLSVLEHLTEGVL